MKEPTPHSNSQPSRRTFLGQLAAFSALLTQPRLLWSAMQAQAAAALAWATRQSPLMTRWSRDVDPRMPLPLYPRPQMMRKDWLNLNGIWEYQPGASATEQPPFGKPLSGVILVPCPVESALSGVMEHHDRLWYRRHVTVPVAWQGRRVLLHFGAVDYESEIFVNGQRAGLHTGGYDPFTYDITPLLKAGEPAELIVRVFDPTEAGGQPRGKQNTMPRGITYTPTTGIWQTVWLEPVSPTHLQALTLTPDIDRGLLKLTAAGAATASGDSIDIVVKSGQTVVARLTGAPGQELSVPVPRARLWSPDDPFLYTLDITLKQNGRIVDSVASYFGMRKIHIGDIDGQKKMLLNNKFVFQLGPLDQGFWPDGIYTAPTDDALKSDILQMKAMGFNMVRKHIKVEPARWYYWADTLGLLVWQDMPSCNSYPGRAFVPPPVDTKAFENDLTRMVETHRNSPAIILWTIFNESQGQFDTERMVNLVRGLDPTRLINEASGGEIKGFGDVNDIHSYPEPAVRPPNGRQALACGEFGGIGFLIAEHSWQRDGHGYVEVGTSPDLLFLYAEFIDWVHKMRDHDNLSAAVYTELTDVMTEINGLLTYDRIPKVDPATLHQVNTFQFPAPAYKAVLSDSETEAQTWKYVFAQPQAAWSARDYDDSHWSLGPAPFAGAGTHIGTRWTTPDIWLRRRFNPGALTPDQIQNLVLTEFHLGRVEIFLNGVPTSAQQGANRSSEGRYEHRPLSQSVRQALVPKAENVIVVHCHAVGDRQTFDAGLSIRLAVPLPEAKLPAPIPPPSQPYILR